MDEENEAWLAKWASVHALFLRLVAGLSHGEVKGSQACALQTVILIRSVVGTCKWKTAAELVGRLRWIGSRLTRAAPRELSVGNVLRRVSLMVREEYAQLVNARGPEGPSLGDVLRGADDGASAAMDVALPGLLQNVMEQILELYDDVETSIKLIAEHAPNYVQSNDVVLTLGNVDEVFAFLSRARRKQQDPAEIIVLETAPSLDGYALAKRLINGASRAVVVPESSLFALVSRVHKVILPTHAVLADGSLLAPAASLLVALAAKHAAVPVLCLAPLHALCPLYPHDQFNHLDSPNDVLPYAQLPSSPFDPISSFVVNPAFDLVPPHLVDLYVTNTGAHQPTYVYRLLAELYSRHDQHF